MICFLTSSPVIEERWILNPANGFIDELKKVFPADCRALLICSDPDNAETTDEVAGIVKKCLADAGLPLRKLAILDGRNEELAPELVRNANFLILLRPVQLTAGMQFITSTSFVIVPTITIRFAMPFIFWSSCIQDQSKTSL